MPVDADQRIVIRRYQPGDEAAILDLFAASFHHPRSLEHWRWKFQENPFGADRISLALNGDQHLVAHYCGYPVRLQDGSTTSLIHQIGDTMTVPSIRHIGRGPTSVIGRTAFHFFETFCEGQVAFNYGFNVGNIQRFSERFLRSFRVESVGYRVRDLRENPLVALSRWTRLAQGYRIELVAGVDREWDELFDRVSPSYDLLVRRDADYVRWRYLSRPDARYAVVGIRRWGKLTGWIVFVIRENRFTIGDALFDPERPEAFEILLRTAVPQYPVDRIEGWFPDRPRWLSGILTESGFTSQPEPQDLAVMCTPFTRGDAVERMRNSFYYTMGDSDLF